MTRIEDLSPEELKAEFFRSAIVKLPEEVASVMLRDPTVLAILGLPQVEFVQLWGERFERKAMFDALRSLVRGETINLSSFDGATMTDEARLDEDGSAVLRSGTEGLRFQHVRLFSDNGEERASVIDEIAATGELSADREMAWRAAAEHAPFDDELFIALQGEADATPEAVYREMAQGISNGTAIFDDLVPIESQHYASLLGVWPLPDTLGAYKAAWVDMAQGLDQARLCRLLRLSGPFAAMQSGLVATASDSLDPPERFEIMQFLASRADPFSVGAAFEVASRNIDNAAMRELANDLIGRICNHQHPMYETAGPALEAALAITISLTARNRTFDGWPLYAKRLALILHASHLLRMLRAAGVDPANLAEEIGKRFGSQARLAGLCDFREAPVFQFHYFGAGLVQAMLIDRVTEAISRLQAASRPEEWIAERDKAVSGAVEAGRGLFLVAAGALDEFEDGWTGLTELEPKFADENLERLRNETGSSVLLNELVKIAVAFEVSPDKRSDVGAAILAALTRFAEPADHLMAAEFGLQIAARWRDGDMADQIIGLLLAAVQKEELPDSGASARYTMLAAATAADRAEWLDRVGQMARNFALSHQPGNGLQNLRRAINLLCDFDSGLAPKLASAKSCAMLAYDRFDG
jgi:hypothetical protein